MPRFPFASLRVRLNLLVLLAILPALGVTFYAYLKERQFQKAYVRDEALLLTRVFTSYEDRLIEGTNQLLTALAQFPQLRSSDPAVCNALFTKLLKQYPHYATLGVAKRNGDLFCSGVPTNEVDVSDRSWLRRAVENSNFAVGDYQISRISRKPMLVCGYPVLDAKGQAQSVVFASLDLAWLNQFVAQVKLPKGASLILLDRNGTILAYHPNPEKSVGKSLPNAPIVKAILAKGEGVTEVSGVDGIPRLYAFTLLHNSPEAEVYMGIGIPEAAPLPEADHALVRNLLGLGLFAILMQIAIVSVGGDLLILRWVRALTKVSRQLAAGDLRARIGLPYGPGELSQLAHTFDEMAESLERQLTERQRAEEELRRANERFGLAAAAVNAIIYDWDIEKNTVERTQGLIEVLGYRPEETAPMFYWWLDHIHPDDHQRVRAAVSAALANGSVFVTEYRLRNKDNQYLYVWDKGLIVRNADGRAVRVVGSILDITDRKQAEAEIRQLNETLEQRVLERTAQLEAANNELDSFSYSVSHDLRAPLRHISGFVDALAQKLERSGAIADPRVAHFLKVIQDSSKTMGQMIESLLTLSRLGRQQLASQPVNLRQLVDTAIALVMSQTETGEERPIEFTITDLPTVMGDPTLLQQVFSNLIDNAVKFSCECRPAKIGIGTLPDGTIFVRDNGVGFQMQYADQLFGAFQRLHSQREFKGTGIGLAIVQRIIHRHGGTIWAESAPKQGATFYFKIRSELAVS